MKRTRFVSTVILSAVTAILAGAASTPAADKELPHLSGPGQIDLGDHLAIFDMPAKFAFVKKNEAQEVLKASGSNPEGVIGLIVPESSFSQSEQERNANNYFVVCRFEDMGHVHDDDANKLNADDILKSYKEGTAHQNEERKEQGIPPIFVGGWAEKPRYEKPSHQVVWAIEVKDQDSTESPVVGVNYNTRILGKRGVLSLNLVTDPDKLTLNKKNAATLLSHTHFLKGERYEDFQPGKDKDAGIGIAGLILGGGALAAAAKFGLLGGAWKFILAGIIAMKKLIIVGIAAIAAVIGKMCGKKKSDY